MLIFCEEFVGPVRFYRNRAEHVETIHFDILLHVFAVVAILLPVFTVVYLGELNWYNEIGNRCCSIIDGYIIDVN